MISIELSTLILPRPLLWPSVLSLQSFCAPTPESITRPLASVPPEYSGVGTSPSTAQHHLSTDFSNVVTAWCERRMSNLEYLLYLNRLAGRSKGDGNSHPILPWVIDFSEPDGAWRSDTSRIFLRPSINNIHAI